MEIYSTRRDLGIELYLS